MYLVSFLKIDFDLSPFYGILAITSGSTLNKSERRCLPQKGYLAIAGSDVLAEEILRKLEAIFGRRIFDRICEKITEDFFGNEMDVRTAIAKRPGLFERAFLSILGDVGIRILEHVCDKVREELGLDKDLIYLDRGDLARFMAIKTSNPHITRLAGV